jgi:bacterioferritin-associated ferredoxin
MYVCICNAVSDREIRQCAELGALTIDQVRDALGVATRCAQCANTIEQILREYHSAQTDPLQNGLSWTEGIPRHSHTTAGTLILKS